MTVSDFKKPDDFLQPIFAKVKMLEELNARVSTYLDDSLKRYCQVANLSQHRLILLVANGSTATQLRFLTPDLLRKFKTDPQLVHIQEIQIKVRPLQSERRTMKKTHKPTISQQSAEIVREIAESIEDPKLREALLRIAKHS